MLVPHPEFSDILVDTEKNKYVVSRDHINVYGYDEEYEGWLKIDSDMNPLTKEEYILYYCKNEDGKIIYNNK